jgi:hypothetical protein
MIFRFPPKSLTYESKHTTNFKLNKTMNFETYSFEIRFHIQINGQCYLEPKPWGPKFFIDYIEEKSPKNQ